MKKILAIILCVLLLATVAGGALAAEGDISILFVGDLGLEGYSCNRTAVDEQAKQEILTYLLEQELITDESQVLFLGDVEFLLYSYPLEEFDWPIDGFALDFVANDIAAKEFFALFAENEGTIANWHNGELIPYVGEMNSDNNSISVAGITQASPFIAFYIDSGDGDGDGGNTSGGDNDNGNGEDGGNTDNSGENSGNTTPPTGNTDDQTNNQNQGDATNTGASTAATPVATTIPPTGDSSAFALVVLAGAVLSIAVVVKKKRALQ